jgi:glyoxylase-like metal-dependent hydrolase (beta-lactamase superfamily II)
MSPTSLPPGMRVFERGWLSSNNLLLLGDDEAVLIDSSHGLHAEQTLALLRQALGPQPLSRVLNTHLHSDHCGGNAALQAAWPGLVLHIPPGGFEAVQRWDHAALSYVATGQHCPRFVPQQRLLPGSSLRLAGRHWQVHAAPGHDPHSVILFEPQSRVLVSADALWGDGFGIVFPELDGEQAFDEVAATLDVIESLNPLTVVPGHGPVFSDVAQALARARSRLAYWQAQPERHRRHAAKGLLKYHLMEVRVQSWPALQAWCAQAPLMQRLMPDAAALEAAAEALLASGALRRLPDGSLADA